MIKNYYFIKYGSYFEITKPFYIADEIIVTNYINFKK